MLKSLIKKLIDGAIYGTGFLLVYGIIGIAVMVGTGNLSAYQVKAKLVDVGVIAAPVPQQPDAEPSTVVKQFLAPSIPIPAEYQIIAVSDSKSFSEAIRAAKANNGATAIVLSPGVYPVGGTIYIDVPKVHITSSTGNPYDVILKGPGMKVKGRVKNIFRVSADNFTIDGVTLTDSPNHLIQIAAESNASYSVINNCILQDAYEQFIKVSYDRNTRPDNKSLEGRVSNNIFQFTHGIAPNYYTGGVDALGAVNWVVENNVFRDIASPSEHISQHAIHFWVNSEGTQVLNNLFIDNDRAIGFGMPLKNHTTVNFSHRGGLIKGNVIYHSDNGDPFGDTGIILEASQGSRIENNVVFMEHSYPRGIEYRFELTKDVTIAGNKTNTAISSRNGGQAMLSNNDENLSKDDFIARYAELMSTLAISELKGPIQKVER